MSDDEEIGFIGPLPSTEWIRAKQERIAQQEAAREATEHADWLAEIRARAEREVHAWAALPCGGDVERVTACSDAFAARCERRDHVMCPRRQLVELKREQAAHRRIRRAEHVEDGVPENVLVAVWDRSPIETEAIKALRQALEGRTIVVLSGGVGCGKTCAAGWWLTQSRGDWISASELATLSPFDEASRERMHSPRLVIDDLGAEYLDAKGFLASMLDSLWDYRYSHRLPTVVTTNLSLKQFQARYSERIKDRLRECGDFVEVSGESMRRSG
jgi:hypothetical protein